MKLFHNCLNFLMLCVLSSFLQGQNIDLNNYHQFRVGDNNLQGFQITYITSQNTPEKFHFILNSVIHIYIKEDNIICTVKQMRVTTDSGAGPEHFHFENAVYIMKVENNRITNVTTESEALLVRDLKTLFSSIIQENLMIAPPKDIQLEHGSIWKSENRDKSRNMNNPDISTIQVFRPDGGAGEFLIRAYGEAFVKGGGSEFKSSIFRDVLFNKENNLIIFSSSFHLFDEVNGVSKRTATIIKSIQ